MSTVDPFATDPFSRADPPGMENLIDSHEAFAYQIKEVCVGDNGPFPQLEMVSKPTPDGIHYDLSKINLYVNADTGQPIPLNPKYPKAYISHSGQKLINPDSTQLGFCQGPWHTKKNRVVALGVDGSHLHNSSTVYCDSCLRKRNLIRWVATLIISSILMGTIWGFLG